MTLRVAVAWASSAAQGVVEVTVADGATVADAVAACDALARAGVDVASAAYAIHGQTARSTTPLANGDRVEITRPLVADAKAARRDRAKARRMGSVKPPNRPGH
jgi:putative ubiquitin-RnfH superfamily antitoxin RatB of RatAB toxin-antitoxin module